jgi:2,3-bisphosphoglycerate-dependent phosphoglycerate mutase
MGKLILIRHGESTWNLENRFTGWVDVDLTEKGMNDAYAAGLLLRDIKLSHGFTSVLKRAIITLEELLRAANQTDVPITKDAALNERMYGDLQGLNKGECSEKFGADLVHQWRRSYDVPPPNGESLLDTANRTLPYFESTILPLAKKENVIVSAHGNSLRAIVMKLDNLTKEEVLNLNIPNAISIIYDIDENGNASNKQVLDVNTSHGKILEGDKPSDREVPEEVLQKPRGMEE